MADWKPAGYRHYKWIVRDPDLLGGKLAVRGTRLSVPFVLGCLAEGMSTEEIAQTYGAFPNRERNYEDRTARGRPPWIRTWTCECRPSEKAGCQKKSTKRP